MVTLHLPGKNDEVVLPSGQDDTSRIACIPLTGRTTPACGTYPFPDPPPAHEEKRKTCYEEQHSNESDPKDTTNDWLLPDHLHRCGRRLRNEGGWIEAGDDKVGGTTNEDRIDNLPPQYIQHRDTPSPHRHKAQLPLVGNGDGLRGSRQVKHVLWLRWEGAHLMLPVCFLSSFLVRARCHYCTARCSSLSRGRTLVLPHTGICDSLFSLQER